MQAAKSPSSKIMKKVRKPIFSEEWQKMKNTEKQTKKMNFLEEMFLLFQEVMDGKQDIIKLKPS